MLPRVFYLAYIGKCFMVIISFFFFFRILGRPALLGLAESSKGLQDVNRHRYCNVLVGAIVSVTGIQKRDEMVFSIVYPYN